MSVRLFRTLLHLCWLPLVFAAFAASGPARFDRIGPYGGMVRSLLIDSHDSATVYLGTSDSHIFKSSDGGRTWTLLFPGLGRPQLVVDTLVQHPVEPAHIYAGAWDLRSAGGGLFESRDAGATWREIRLPRPSPAVRDFAMSRDDPSRMIVGTLAGVWVSRDGGGSWTEALLDGAGFRQVESVAIDPEDPRFLYVGTWHLGYRSTDFGTSWIRNNKGMITDSDLFSFSIDPKNPKVLYSSACTGLYRSTNRGASWTRLRAFANRFLVRAQRVLVDPEDPKRVYAGTTEGLLASGNAGRSWRRVTSSGLVINAVAVDPSDGRKILIGTNTRGVLRSEDGGRTWQESNRGFVHRRIARVLAEPGHPGRFLAGVFADGREGGLYVFDNHADSWMPAAPEDTPGEGTLSLIPLPGGKRLAGTTKGIFLATDGKWNRLGGYTAGLSIYDLVLDAENGWIFAGTNDGVYRSRLDALDFRKPAGYRLIPRVFSLLVDGGGEVLAGTHMGLLRSEDHGVTWKVSSEGISEGAIVASLAASPADPTRILAGTSAGLFSSENGGAEWHPIGGGDLGGDISAVLFLDRPGRRIMAAGNTFGGVFLSEDGGAAWRRIFSPNFPSPVSSLAQDPAKPNVFYLGTATEGVYRLRLQ